MRPPHELSTIMDVIHPLVARETCAFPDWLEVAPAGWRLSLDEIDS